MQSSIEPLTSAIEEGPEVGLAHADRSGNGFPVPIDTSLKFAEQARVIGGR